PEFAHDELAQVACTHFAQAAGQQQFLHTGNGRVDFFGAYRPLAQGQVQAAAQFVDIEFDARAIAFDDGRHDEFYPFVGREAAIASRASATATYRVALFRDSGVYDLRIEAATERAFHGWQATGETVAVSVLTVNRQTRREFVDTF